MSYNIHLKHNIKYMNTSINKKKMMIANKY
jgi:hypothetical protein